MTILYRDIFMSEILSKNDHNKSPLIFFTKSDFCYLQVSKWRLIIVSIFAEGIFSDFEEVVKLP